MIVSHAHRFIFVAVPKTATQSIRAALRPHLARDDWEQANWRVSRRSSVPELAAIGHGHITAAEAEPWLSDVWGEYFKFAFVRNPWHRFISTAFFENARRPLFLSRPRPFLKLLIEDQRVMSRLHYRPQHAFLTIAEDLPAMDFIGRFERLAEDFRAVCRHLVLPEIELPHLHRSDHGSPAQYYDDDLRTRVESFYARDIRLFDYHFEWDEGTGASAAGREPAQDSGRP